MAEATTDNTKTTSPFVEPEHTHPPEAEEYNYSSSDDDSEEEQETEKPKSKKPPNNNFTQQRLASFNPVFTARTVIPILMAIAIFFVPLGAAMWYASHVTQDFAIDYSQCENEANYDTWSEIPQEYLEFHLKHEVVNKPQWKLSTDESQMFDDERTVCQVQFDIPEGLSAPIYLFYRLHRFHANHRRYVKSFSEDQITGSAASENTIKTAVGQNCEPMSVDDEGRIIYPCGLIANSMFNDTYTTLLKGVNGTDKDYDMTEEGIAWETDKNRFQKTKYSYKDVVPPPNWYKRYPNGYNETNFPDISQWYQFQNWMHTAGFPTFNKLALRNDNDKLESGTYEISIGLHFPVLPYKGKKYIYFSQRSVIGGKNDFLGISWMVGGCVCFLVGISLLIVNFIKPRKTGDTSLLSWNRERAERDEIEAAKSEEKSS